MRSRQILKELIVEMMSGDLKKAINYLETSNEMDTNKTQLNIIITLTQMANKPKGLDRVPISDIKKIIDLCCSQITNPSETEVNNYYRSLYHIFKYLRDKISLKETTTLYEHIFPDWLPDSISTEVYEILVHYNALISKETIIPNLANADVKSLVKCLKQQLRLCRLTFHKNPTLLFQKIRLYVNLFQEKISLNYFYEFCLYIFELLDFDSVGDLEASKEAFYALTSIILLNVAKNSIETKLIEEAFKKMKILLMVTPELRVSTEIFELFYRILMKRLENYSQIDLYDLQKLHDRLETIIQKGLSSFMFKVFSFISETIRSRVMYFDKIKKEPGAKLNTEIVVEFIKIFEIVSNIIKKDRYSHTCVEGCKLEYNYNHSFTISSLGGTFLNISLRYDSENIKAVNDAAVVSIKTCLKHVSTMKSKGCGRWVGNWRLIGSLIYNIATRFYQNNDYRLARFYLKMLATHIIQFEKGQELITENCLVNTLNLIGNCYGNIQQYRSALTFLSLGVYIQPDYGKLWSNWMNIKFKANSNDVGNIYELTLKDILESDADVIKTFLPDFNLTSKKLESLLLEELKSYNKLWASKIPINNVSKQIFELSNDPHILTLAFTLSWEKTLTIQDDSYLKCLGKTIALINKSKSKTSAASLYLSVLHFIEFQIKSFEIYKKNIAEMNENTVTEKPLLKPYEEPPNPNDRCDINPTYYNNKIENNLNLFKILFKSVDLWTKLFQSADDDLKNLFNEFNLRALIKKAAFELRIQNYRYKMLKIWFLYLQFGKIINNVEVILEAIGFILENINCGSDLARSLEEKALIYLNDDNVSAETKITFYVNKSFGYLQSNRLTEGLELLQGAKSIITQDSFKILEARIQFLESLYLQKGCNLGIVEHNKNFIVVAHNAFTTIADFYKKSGSKCLYVLSVLFDISLMIGKMYKHLRMPREIRCYTNESLLLAQQIVLPLRTAQFFSLLAFTDLLGAHFDDCQVKISGIDYILGYESNIQMKKTFSDDFNDGVDVINKEFERLNLSRDEIEVMLDVPVDHRLKNLQGSPILNTKKFTLPSFVYHLDCACFFCLNFDFSRLILESTHLLATFYMYQNNNSSAIEFFKGASRIYKCILKKYESKNLSDDMTSLFKKELKETYCEFLIDYATYFARKRDPDQSLKIINEIVQIMGNDLIYNTSLYTEVLYNKISFMSAKENDSDTDVEMNTEISDMSVYLVKTPESQMSTVKLSDSPPNEPTIKRRFKKELKFDLSDTESNKPKPKVASFKLKSPLKTPAPSSRIKIYTPSTSTRNKIKPIVLPPSPNVLNVIPVIPQKSPENSKTRTKSKKVLNENTKLLTQKLKNECKDVLKESNVNKVTKNIDKLKKPSTSATSTVRRTRKNSENSDISKKVTKENASRKIKVESSSSSSSQINENVTKRRPVRKLVKSSSTDTN